MKAPQIIYVVLVAIGLLASANKHGKTTKTNFWISLVSSCIAIGLLIWGGFFS